MIGLFFSLLLLRQIIGYFGLGQEVHLLQKGSNKKLCQRSIVVLFFFLFLQQCDLIEKMIKSSAASGWNHGSNGDSHKFFKPPGESCSPLLVCRIFTPPYGQEKSPLCDSVSVTSRPRFLPTSCRSHWVNWLSSITILGVALKPPDGLSCI